MEPLTRTRDLIVIGASAGGVAALQRLAAGLPADLPAAVLVVLHVGTHPSVLPDLLNYRGPLPARHAVDGEAIVPGRIYVAPPDHHLLVEGRALRLTHGPREHHTRPAVDPLFRSAALEHGSAVVGIVLTGCLDDGTAGLQAVKACGGVAIVQDPREAEEPSMPESALRHVEVDHCVALAEMPKLLQSLLGPVPSGPGATPAPGVGHEQALQRAEGNSMEDLNAVGTPSTFVCPDCRGSLWEMRDAEPPRFRCHTGHAYSLRSLQETQSKATEEALWSAVRALQEKEQLMRRMAEWRSRHGSEAPLGETHREAAERLAAQAEVLRRLLVEGAAP
ncbi:chemotaxis protein CheB [Caldimonas tepidiphila]|uniref:chemotaxis protein CheB n=1 Tax=Caldimonas tepidiphila TaxID=2315841 RepID=UPI000E5A54EE|nr:chemotaxis protein CheB [Caldimonas tepidiphila]